MTRRCSQCSNQGHNSRTCPTRGAGGNAGVSGGRVRLFGVFLTVRPKMRTSASMGNLSDHGDNLNHMPAGYISDDTATHISANRRKKRKKGVPWTEEEHRRFLVGLQKLGKGNWQGISRNYVVSRTPSQVASHAQKYYNHQNLTQPKRRLSVFDMIPEDMIEEANPVFSSNLSVNSNLELGEGVAQQRVTGSSRFTPMVPTFFPPRVPVSYPFWPTNPTPPY